VWVVYGVSERGCVVCVLCVVCVIILVRMSCVCEFGVFLCVCVCVKCVPERVCAC